MGKNKKTFILISCGVIIFHSIGIIWLGCSEEQLITQQVEKKIVVKTVALSKPKAVAKAQPKPTRRVVKKKVVKKKEVKKENKALIAKTQEILSKIRRKDSGLKTAKTIDKLQVDSSSKTTRYHEIVGTKLKQALRLPEQGAVKIHLTLSRAGKVLQVEIISDESELNREYVKKKLPQLPFPSFGSYLKEEKHTFIVTLQSEK